METTVLGICPPGLYLIFDYAYIDKWQEMCGQIPIFDTLHGSGTYDVKMCGVKIGFVDSDYGTLCAVPLEIVQRISEVVPPVEKYVMFAIKETAFYLETSRSESVLRLPTGDIQIGDMMIYLSDPNNTTNVYWREHGAPVGQMITRNMTIFLMTGIATKDLTFSWNLISEHGFINVTSMSGVSQ